ncbi:haloacid dehalogenase [Enterococcus saigonensis]|uniref:Haloacid dehalogenase n=1 Tax=Enterococcus saigonensis TaxID=1805431 RepID=A0A679I5R1_9ENTE|nr:HAD family phosphatase [Enterococcus saigonensis]BCA84898.1 haloacid dehalogenase [Enterococcus saigonensis]
MKGVLFDFNGTLIDDTKKHEDAWQTFITNVTGNPISQSDFAKYFHGKNAQHTLEYVFKRPLTFQEVADYAEKKEALYRNLCLADPNYALLKGVPEFLTLLQEKEIPFTIATASGKTNLDFYFETLNLKRWFTMEKVVYDDGNMISKPDPDPYLKGAQRLNLPATECVVFEDAPAGLLSAYHATAAKIVAVATSEKIETLTKFPGVTLAIKDFTDPALTNLINQFT